MSTVERIGELAMAIDLAIDIARVGFSQRALLDQLDHVQELRMKAGMSAIEDEQAVNRQLVSAE